MFVQQDPDMLKIFDAAGPVTTDAMGRRGLVWSHRIGGARESIRVGDRGTTVRGGAERGVATTADKQLGGARRCGAGLGAGARGVHWVQTLGGFAARGALREVRLDWMREGKSGGLSFADPVDLSPVDASFDLRLIGTPGARSVRVRLRDDAGRTWAQRVRISRLAGGGQLRPYWAQTVRIDAHEAPSAFDESAVVAAEIVSDSPRGTVWIVDAAVREPRIPDVPDRALPRLDLGRAKQREGDRGTGTIRIPYRIRGAMPQPVRFDVSVRAEEGRARDRLVRVNVPVGQRKGSIAVRYPRNKRDDLRRVYVAQAQAVRGVALHDYHGRAIVIDDDPPPKITFEPKRATYRPGQNIRVRVRLSEPVSYRFWASARPRDAKGFAPMRNADVPRRWLRRHGGRPSQPRRRLSRTIYRLDVDFPPGKRVGTLTVPTVRHRQKTPAKRLRLVWRVPHHKKHVTVATVKPRTR